MSDREQKIREKREDFLRLAEAQAQRRLHDVRWNFLRTRQNRKRLIVAIYTILTIYGVANFLDQPFVVLPALVAYLVLLLLLQTVSRGIVDMPQELADERMREVRGDVYRYSFLGAVGIFSLIMILDIIIAVANKAGAPLDRLSGTQWMDMMFLAFFMTLPLPNAIFLWTEPEL